ncbi:hypothetical protein HCX48_12450 [Rhodocyclus tenuis]|uniref:Uncharacterized protein n=2 Tax=Rhodocyclus TaxID=1064 RepID=A0A6L5JXH3_RHOTE|nr:hypothetical protein [Rhodocyclus gracilis]MQY51334.1 hypothetical protein [Rhodocyclus gracilis]MRD72077.1 hypothetical protein [Rhodocyclus gracilis]NJA90025.1 hypothetical protein [Rhodocyclus gracilis]
MTDKKPGFSSILQILKKDPWKRRAQELRAALPDIEAQLRDARSDTERSLLTALLELKQQQIGAAARQSHSEWNRCSAEAATLEEKINAARAERVAS